jgi:hypothetical protein
VNIIQTAILTAVGVLTTAAITYTGKRLFSMFGMIKEISVSVQDLKKQNDAQTENVATLLSMQRPNIRTLRSFCYAFRELGVNGSITRAFEHVDDMEDTLNKCLDKNAKSVMGACE